MFKNLSADSLPDIRTKLGAIFTVMHGFGGYDISTGIEVKFEK
jgi:hypothetical protein